MQRRLILTDLICGLHEPLNAYISFIKVEGQKNFQISSWGLMVIFYFVGLWLRKAKMVEEFRNRTFALCPETRRRQLLSKTVAQKQGSSVSPTPCLTIFFLSRFPRSDHGFGFCCLYLCERVWVSIRAYVEAKGWLWVCSSIALRVYFLKQSLTDLGAH